MTRNSSMFDIQMDHCQKIMRARSSEEIKAIVGQFSDSLDFNNFAITTDRTGIGTPSNAGTHHFIHDISGCWATWIETGTFPWGESLAFDAAHVMHRMPPMFWNSLGHTNIDFAPADIRTRATRRHRLAGEYGQHCGITFPIHIPGANWSFISFIAGSRASRTELTPRLLSGYYFAACLQSTLARMTDAQARNTTQLTLRECEIMRWSAIGKTSWEIARIQRISERTVNYHLYRAAAKLGVKGRRAAVAQAIAHGLITL